jgi:hypothetical protein
MATAPQALMSLVAVTPPDVSEVPKLTLNGATYPNLCTSLAGLTLTDGLAVTCNGDEPLTVMPSAPAAL